MLYFCKLHRTSAFLHTVEELFVKQRMLYMPVSDFERASVCMQSQFPGVNLLPAPSPRGGTLLNTY